jgi:hypothetical protein
MFICAAFAGFIYYFENKKNIPSFIISSLIAIIFFINYFYGNFYSKSLRLVYVNPDLAIEKPDFIYNGWQGYYKELKGDKDIEITEFVKTLSDEIKVAADNFFAPHVSGRRYIYHLKNYKWADIIIDRKSNNAVYEGFSIVKETKLWKIYKKDKNNL